MTQSRGWWWLGVLGAGLLSCSHAEAPIVASMTPAPPMRREPPPRSEVRRNPNTDPDAATNDQDMPEAEVMRPALAAPSVNHPEEGYGSFSPAPDDEYTGPAVLPKTLAKSTLAMALRLYDLKGHDPGNFLVSPYDLLRVLTMAQAGSNQASADEIGQVLHLEMPAPQVIAGVRQVQDNFSKSDLKAGNAVLIAEDTGLSLGMKNKLIQAFGSRIEHRRVDDMGQGAQNFVSGDGDTAFSAQDKNASVVWANLSLNSSRMALLGSTRYATKWEAKRGKSALLNKKGEVPSFAPGGAISTFEDDHYRAVQLPCKSPRFALLVIFPKSGKAALKNAPALMNLQAIFDGLAPAPGSKFSLPAVSMVTSVNLTAAVRDMGLRSLFDANKAQLSNLGPAGNGMFARDLIQGVIFDMNDQGVTWSAYSALKFNSSINKAKVRGAGKLLNTPFLFLLHDTEWHMPLMLGRVEAI